MSLLALVLQGFLLVVGLVAVGSACIYGFYWYKKRINAFAEKDNFEARIKAKDKGKQSSSKALIRPSSLAQASGKEGAATGFALSPRNLAWLRCQLVLGMILTITHLRLSELALKGLACSMLPDPYDESAINAKLSYRLTSDPLIECYTAAHAPLAVLAWLARVLLHTLHFLRGIFALSQAPDSSVCVWLSRRGHATC